MLIADACTIAGFYLAVPWLISRFAAQDTMNLLVVSAAYLLMCAGLWAGKKYAPPKHARTNGKADKQGEASSSDEESCSGCTTALSIPFAFMALVMVIEGAGAMGGNEQNTKAFDNFLEHNGTIGPIAIIGALLVIAVFPILMYWKPKPAAKPRGAARGFIITALSALAINTMVWVTTAYWEWQFSETEPMDVAIGGKILVWVLGYAVMLMFFAPPRLALITLSPSRWAYVSFAVVLGVAVWRMMG